MEKLHETFTKVQTLSVWSWIVPRVWTDKALTPWIYQFELHKLSLEFELIKVWPHELLIKIEIAANFHTSIVKVWTPSIVAGFWTDINLNSINRSFETPANIHT